MSDETEDGMTQPTTPEVAPKDKDTKQELISLWESHSSLLAEVDQLGARARRLDREVLMMYGAVIILCVAVARFDKIVKGLIDAATITAE